MQQQDCLKTCSEKRSASLGLDLCFVPVLLFLLYRIIAQPSQLSADCGFFLYGAKLLLNGGRLYLDWFDINPPLIFYFNLVPAAISQALSTRIIPTFLIAIYLLVVWSTFSIRKSLLKSQLNPPRFEVGLLLICWIVFHLFVLHQNDFGQRDHLLIVLFVPYFVFRWLRWSGLDVGTVRAALLGVAAGLGVCLKPAFLALPIVVELYWLISSRFKPRPLVSPEIIASILTGLAYLLHFVFLPADIRDYLFGFVVPLTAEVYPKHATVPLLEVLNHKLLFAAMIAGILPFVIPYRNGPLWNLARSSGILVTACFVTYLIHKKGFSYHLDPILGAASLIPGIILAEFTWAGLLGPSNFSSLSGSIRKISALLLMALTLTMFALVIEKSFETQSAYNPDISLNKALSKYSHAGDNVLILSPEVLSSQPYLLQLDRHQATRFSGALFTLPVLSSLKIQEDATGAKASQYERTILNGLDADIKKFEPTVIVIDDFQWKPSKLNFTMSEYLDKIGFISRSMKDYELAENMGTLHIYKRLVR